jgi:hypothetical protein
VWVGGWVGWVGGWAGGCLCTCVFVLVLCVCVCCAVLWFVVSFVSDGPVSQQPGRIRFLFLQCYGIYIFFSPTNAFYAISII